MDLNFTEYDNYSNDNTEQFDYNKYWVTPDTNVKSGKKNKVTFDDILSNMNLVVGKNGVLQQMTTKRQIDPSIDQQIQFQYEPIQTPLKKSNTINVNKTNVTNATPVSSEVKHSFIYNKYFKDYNDTYKPEPNILVPKTIEEYKQMVKEQRLKDIEERKRISQIKSTKLMFTTNQGYNNGPTKINASKNNLRFMNFK
jgi:hypothetical protein